MDVLAIVPARGGSKSVPRKNIRLLAGRPLIAYTIDAAQEAASVTRVVVTTEDAEIADVARAFGAEVPFLRPPALATDAATDLPVFQHCVAWLREHEGYAPDLVVHLRPTAPLRRAEHIDRAIALLVAHPEADAVRSVCPAAQHPLKMWRIEDQRLEPYVPAGVYGIDEAYNMPRQGLPPAYIQNGSVDVVRTSVIEGGSMTGRCIVAMEMAEDESVNIDSPIDWDLAELAMTRRKAEIG